MKKIFVFMLCLLISFSSLVGCEAYNNDPNTDYNEPNNQYDNGNNNGTNDTNRNNPGLIDDVPDMDRDY